MKTTNKLQVYIVFLVIYTHTYIHKIFERSTTPVKTVPDAEVPGRNNHTSLTILSTQSSSSSQTWASEAQINMCYSITVLSDFVCEILQLKKAFLLWEYPHSRLLGHEVTTAVSLPSSHFTFPRTSLPGRSNSKPYWIHFHTYKKYQQHLWSKSTECNKKSMTEMSIHAGLHIQYRFCCILHCFSIADFKLQ